MSFETVDGLRLNGWFFAVEGPSPRMTVVVFNGNAGNRAHRVPWPQRCIGTGCSASSITAATAAIPGLHRRRTRCRQSGRSGIPGRAPGRRFVAAGVFRRVAGTAVAVDLAVEHPPTALVLRSPFTSMSDVGQHHYPFLPVRFLPGPVCVNRSDSAKSSAHARHRRWARPNRAVESSRLVYEAATSPKTFLLIPKPITTITSCSRVTK